MPDHDSSSARHLANAMRADDLGSPAQVPGFGRLVVWLARLTFHAARWGVRRVRAGRATCARCGDTGQVHGPERDVTGEHVVHRCACHAGSS